MIATVGATGARAQSVGALLAATRQVAAVTNAVTARAASAASTSAGMAAASSRALQYQTQVNSALDLAMQAQAAAQAAAKALNQNQLANVADGLTTNCQAPSPCGLTPAVTQITPASADSTGLATWQGAALPTVTAPNQVLVVQTDPRALLSWTTFNVGQNTTLTFQQQQNGVAQPSWVVLNRVVGQIDPATGLRNPNLAPAPSQILGSIKADGTVLVINQNGILFGPTSQVNVGSLIATSLEFGSVSSFDPTNPNAIPGRNAQFLDFGLLGFQEQQSSSASPATTFSAQLADAFHFDAPEGSVQVQAGASLNSADGGYLMLIAPQVVNSGQLSSADGEVALQSGRNVFLTASGGDAGSVDPDVRGLVVTGSSNVADSVDNTGTGIIEAPRGYVSIGASTRGTINDAGVILSTTSVSENGYVNIFGSVVDIAQNAVISVGPDSSTTTIPQDPTSLADFKPSRIRIGQYTPGSTDPTTGALSLPATTSAMIDIGANSLIYAPGANISIGADPGATTTASTAATPNNQVVVESGAVIDAAGLTNVLIPASRNSIEISPVLGNELADAPAFRNGFLNGATVFLDPRLSGVTADGVAWAGSPLISAGAYAQQVGETVSELMVKGGNVTLGVQSAAPGASLAQTPQVDVKAGAVIDVDGGWKTYQAGEVLQSYLVDAGGAVVPISQANPNDTYVAVYNGYTATQPRWGVSQTYVDPVQSGSHNAGQYTEGQDAGSVTLTGSVIALDGKVNAGAFAGPEQILSATPGTAAPTIYGDVRTLQAAPSQLPAGGYLDIEALGPGQLTGGADINIVGSASYTPGPATTISLNADAVSAMGLSQLTVQTSGKISVAKDAAVTLAPGGDFEALAGRTITIDGSITVASGAIDLTTADIVSGSVLAPEPLVAFSPLQPGPFDIVINGQLNVAGRWANDFNAPAGDLVGAAYLNGGEITLDAAPRVTSSFPVDSSPGAKSINDSTTDISGSIVIDPGALLDLAGGAYVSPTGGFTLTSRGGNLSLYDDTSYFQLISAASPIAGGFSAFRVSGIDVIGEPQLAINPAAITSRVSIADGSILDAGFAGGGTFTLTTPYFSFGAAGSSSVLPVGSAGAVLPLDFFSSTGFSNFKITSYGTDLIANNFQNGYGGYNAVLETQVATVASGQTLSLTQSVFSPVLSTGQITGLEQLGTGSSLYAVLTPSIPADAWDQKPVSLTLGGLLELHVDAGGQIIGSAGGSLTVSELYNQGLIRIPGGSVTQSEVLPALYSAPTTIAVDNLSDVFGPPNSSGMFSETAPNALGVASAGIVLTNAQVAGGVVATTPIYLLGDLNAGEGVRLAPGSVIDLSGEAIVNPRAAPQGGLSSANFTDGVVVAGGSLTSTDVFNPGGSLFRPALGASVYGQLAPTGLGIAEGLDAQPGSMINLDGAQATFDRPSVVGPGSVSAVSYAPTLIWSNGGDLTLNQGGAITGADIQAQGGAPLALGGTLSMLNPVLYQSDPTSPTHDAVSADTVTSAGFATFIAQGSLTSVGDVTLSLPRSVFVETPASFSVGGLTAQSAANTLSPVIGSGGVLEIDAPYISLDGAFQSVSTPNYGSIGANSVLLKANAIDITGAVIFDQSVSQATLSATGDIRLIGVAPSSIGVSGSLPTTLVGQLAANGDLTLQSAQIYPTTGSTFTVSTTGAASPAASNGGMIRFESAGAAPAAPYSAGGALVVEAANIDQDGVVRVPLGALTLGSNSASTFAPATATLSLDPGSTTSVSADGLAIPYGTTTDQVEWYFTPTSSDPLTAPPAGVLTLAGGSITASSGATVDLKGGGDVYAYEFISGTGGTRDVLDQFNSDQFSSNNGYQYPDGRQIYAIVPGLSSAAVAALDPVYSANYSAIYGPSQAGLSVYFNAAPGLAAGWYTLLPAQYALLPGGLRVVQDTSAAVPPPAGGSKLSDGTIVASGYFGVAGVNTRSSSLDVFDVQSQSVILQESNIALTSGNEKFAADAALAGTPTPQLPIDAGRLILSPVTNLTLDATFQAAPSNLPATSSAPALVGRGSEVDISGAALTIDDAANPVAQTPGAIVLSDASLSNLDAASLLLGGVRTDNVDGATSLDITSNAITVASGATITAPEIILAVDGKQSKLTVASGASIIATGAVAGESTGDYVIDGLAANGKTVVQDAQGGFLRVSNGPERLLSRLDVQSVAAGSVVVGAADLQGASLEINSLGALTLNKSVRIDATSVALGARRISFGATGAGLLLTPQLQALLHQAASLTLESQNAISFAAGNYDFNTLTLDAPGIRVVSSGAVGLTAGSLSISNSNPALAACGASGTLACGSGALTLDAGAIAFGSGTVQTYGAGASVTLNATGGVFADGAATLNVGPAALTINSPFVGDRGTGAPNATIPSLTLATTGAVSIASATPASAFTTAPSGTPGSDLTIDGASVSIQGTELRATAGTLDIQSATGIAISGGALLATPGYSKVFGDPADTTTVSAPGGLLSLTALAGDIAVSDDSTFSIGGGQGQAGSLSLIAQNGQVYAYHGVTSDGVALASTFSAAAPGAGASLTLDTGGSFDLSAFAAGAGQQFTGAVSVRAGAGDLTLAAGDTLTATSVQLTADGGQVGVSGEIDTSGVNGGDVSLYGATGVHLTSTAVIDAHANGYGLTSTLQAKGGDVILGVEETGAISVDQGATIDVAALQTGNRLVNMNRTVGTDYTYVAGDVGGTVTFLAPVIERSSGDTVNVSVQGAVTGASSVVLEGFRRFDLADLAANPNYVGVSVANGTATLDLSATGVGQINPLADPNGPVVQFVQNFNVSADYGALNGLASQSNFHARPDIDLEYSGNIVLASNWNLGAGVVNIAGAVAAGLMTPDAGLPGQYAVTPGAEGQILAQYTTATYRVGGSFYGEPGVLSLRAGGALDIQGSITDGFFQFADQTDPNYLSQVLGGGNRTYQGALAPACLTGDCSTVPAYSASATPNNFVYFVFPGGDQLPLAPYATPAAPYSAEANAPAALGSLAGGTGDPLGSAQLFPLLPTTGGGTTPISSWSYQLVAGADLTGASGRPSVNPLTVVAGSLANVTVEGQHVYSYGASKGVVSVADSLDLEDAEQNFLAADQWYSAFVEQDPGLAADSYTSIFFASGTASIRTTIDAMAKQFFAANPSDPVQILKSGQINTTLSGAADFMVYLSDNFSKIASFYKAPPEVGILTAPTYATAPSLVRTGTGSIEVAASGTIDLRNGATPTVLNLQGKLVTVTDGGLQLGGAAIYTAGTLADLNTTTATDVATGAVYSVDLGANAVTSDNLDNQGAPYTYGAGNPNTIRSGLAGILVADPVYAEGGGDVTLDAGVDVLSRRDTVLEHELGGVGAISATPSLEPWIGSGDQPWRTGVIGGVVNLQIDPQLFAEGVGTLGGGDITVHAGRNISDLSVVATDSATTANVGGIDAAGTQPQALVALGGGDVSVFAGADILGGRLDVAAGDATVIAGGAIVSAGEIVQIPKQGEIAAVTAENTLRVRLSDGDVAIQAGGEVTLQGISALGVASAGPDSAGFYSAGSGVSIIADGAVSVANSGFDVLTTSIANPSASAVYPGAFEAVSITSGLNVNTSAKGIVASEALLYPDPTGTLTLLAAGDIAPATIAQLDSDPTLLPGAFSIYANLTFNPTGLAFGFPAVLPDTSDVVLRELHNASITHAGDSAPNRIVAGGDIDDMILATAKQTRIAAGRDIVNMVFVGQNISASDVTRITAGRDITASTALETPVAAVTASGQIVFGPQLPAVQGDTFVLGGPGALFVEAGRNAGPFLNSAVTDGFAGTGATPAATGQLTYGGGIITVGNLYNPALSSQGADIYTEFGVAKGQDFAALISTYLAPSSFASQPGYLFEQTTDANGNPIPDSTKEIYSLSLQDWLKSIAPDVISRYDTTAGVKAPPAGAPDLIAYMEDLESGKPTPAGDTPMMELAKVSDQTMPLIPWLLLNENAAVATAYGASVANGAANLTYQQAFNLFEQLPTLTQREFLIKDVYFNELIQTSIPTSPSYLVYSRGYDAVNTLFPGSDGYTQNSLSGGPAGASTTVETGNLDLRLATIQTEEGGNIAILGPGGRVLAGSTVSTSVQASRRDYAGGALYSGNTAFSPLTAEITQIPPGYEGVLTLRGGSIDSFTDGDFLLNQSRAFTEEGGDVAIWSSNADVNAGQGPRTTADVPPVVVNIDENGYSQVSTTSAVSGAGIGAFAPDNSGLAPDVFLIAPRGTVDAGAAGVRSAGNVFVAAFQVANADAIQAQGSITGAGGPAAVNVAAQTSGDAASTAAAQAATAASGSRDDNQRPLIFVDVLGFLADESGGCSDDDSRRGKCKSVGEAERPH